LDPGVPSFPRFKWPKHLPALSEEQQRISDDFMKHWLELLPTRYWPIETFNHTYPTRRLPNQAHWRTLELGAGIGGHLKYEDLSRQDYHCIELREGIAAETRKLFADVTMVTGDCQQHIPYADEYFDRVVAVHVLEHLPRLPDALDQVDRVLRPGGIISAVLPCDPGLAYEIGRKLSAERLFKRRYHMSYRWLARREHINSPAEILYLLLQRFQEQQRTYFPLRIPIINLNLCIGITLKKPDTATHAEDHRGADDHREG